MSDHSAFEARLADAVERYAERAPTIGDPEAYARAIATGGDRVVGRSWQLGRSVWPLARITVLIGAALLLAASAVVVGAWLLDREASRPAILAIARPGGLDFAAADGSSPRAVLDDGSTFNPAWSASGRYVAVSQVTETEPNLLRILDDDGAIVGEAAGVSRYVWDPGADRLAVLRLATNQIVVIAPDGRVLAAPVLPEGRLDISSFDWSPDGRSIAVSLCLCDTRSAVLDGRTAYAVWIVTLDGRAPRDLLRTLDEPALYPAWSPDGTAIAYVIPDCLDGSCSGSIRIVDAATGARRAEVEEALGGSVVVWSPSGGQLAFTAVVAGQSDIFVVTRDMTTVDRLTTDPANDGQPAWTADGAAILFWHEVPEGQGARIEIWAARPDGSGLVRLADDTHGAALQPTP